MTSFLYQTKINFIRIILRNKKFFFFDLSMPIIFYILYTKIIYFGSANNSIWNLRYMVSMMIYSCLLGSVITVANTLIEEHTSHFDLLVKIAPLPKLQYYSSMIIVFLTLNFVSCIAIGLVGIFVNQVNISLINLIVLSILSIMGSIPLIIIGFMISKLNNANTVNLLTSIIVFPVAMLSGLWWPIEMMPKWIRPLGESLPTYSISQIDLKFLNLQHLQFSFVLLWFAWLMVLLLIIWIIEFASKHERVS